MITPEQERAFYDRQYDAFLSLPDHALRIDRAVLEKNLDDPAHPFFERRRLYRAAIAALLEDPLPGRRVLDYGCGWGILAIAAARLGAGRVVAVDLDENALTATHANAEANRVDIETLPTSTPLTETFDLVLANILAVPLCRLAPLLGARLTHDGGQIALSGILSDQADVVRAAYLPWAALEVTDMEEGWVLLAGPTRAT